MTEVKNENVKLMIIAIIIAVVIIGGVGYTYSFFNATATNSTAISGVAASPSIRVDVSKISDDDDSNGLVPQLDQYITSAVIGRNGSCVDDNFNNVCQVYKILVTNTSDVALSLNGTLEIDNGNNPNLKWARIDATTDTIFTSPALLGPPRLTSYTVLTRNDTLEALSEKEYFVVIWISETGDAQSDTGDFDGVVTFDNVEKTPVEITGADGQFTYALVGDNKIQISKYLGSETNVVIPATYDGYEVYSVGNVNATSAKATRYNIFNTIGNTTVTSVTIEDGVEEIKLGAFDRCSGITTLSLPDSVTLIDDYAFYQCTNLAGTLDLPSNLVEMGRLAFSGDTKITGELVIPNTVTTMDAGVFQQCSGLTSVTFEENSTLTSIPEYTFYKCTNLSGEIILPNTITSIGPSAFYEVTKLTGDLVIPNAVTTIGRSAFHGCTGFNGELTLSSNLVEIGDYAFNHCSGFTNTTLDIPATLQKIGSLENDATHVFYDFATKTIEEYTVNNSNNGIGTKFKVVDGILYTKDGTRMAAYPASKVGNSYVMPEGVTTIDELSFSRAGSSYSSVPDTGLKSITLPNSYVISTTFPSNYINVGNTLTTALYLYTGVNEVLVKDDNPNYKSIDGILYSKDETELWYIPHAKTGNIVIPNTVTTIRSGSLALGILAATSIYIPASVTNIEATAILEINQLLIDNITSVTFDPNCVYQINASGKVEKTQ